MSKDPLILIDTTTGIFNGYMITFKLNEDDNSPSIIRANDGRELDLVIKGWMQGGKDAK